MDNFYYICTIFFFYSFLGWIMEVILGIFQHGKIINRGFLIGPVLPIYGVGSLLITLLLSKYQNDIFVLFFMSMAVCAILEYSTSYIMEKIFKNRWWDYSEYKFNINGRICLETMIPFGIGSLIIFKLGNPFLFYIHNTVPNNIEQIVFSILLFIFIIDLIMSFNVIITLKHISSTLKTDSTEVITKKVKEILFSKNFLFKRLFESFPNMKIFNKMSILKDKLNKTKELIKKEKINEKIEKHQLKLEAKEEKLKEKLLRKNSRHK